MVEVGNWYLVTDTISSKLIYFVNGDGGSGVALQGDRGPDPLDPLEVEVQLENVALKDQDLQVLLERLVKWDLLEVKVKLEHVMKKVTREIRVVLVNKEL